MGILQDTIRDARRPRDAGWVRRAAMEEIETSLPEEDSAAQGMQTVFRFQKEGPNKPREASHQSGGVGKRWQAADPLSAGIEAEGWTSPANNVDPIRIGITARAKSSGSNLETGQGEHASPNEIVAVNANVASEKVQSLRVSAPSEAKLHREQHKSRILGGSEQAASGREISFLSQPSGRGAPSETYPTAQGAQTSSAAGPTPAFASAVAAPAAPGSAVEPTIHSAQHTGQPTGSELPFHATARAITSQGQVTAPNRAGNAHGNGPPAVASHSHATGDTPPAPAAAQLRAAPPVAEPSLAIGRIDVVVVARETPAQAVARSDGNRGFLSRNYLKRL